MRKRTRNWIIAVVAAVLIAFGITYKISYDRHCMQLYSMRLLVTGNIDKYTLDWVAHTEWMWREPVFHNDGMNFSTLLYRDDDGGLYKGDDSDMDYEELFI